MLQASELNDMMLRFGNLSVPVIVMCLTFAGAMAWLAWFRRNPPLQTVFALTFSFGLLGGVAGVIAGSSDQPLVGALVTGVLSIVSALAAFGLGKDARPGFDVLVPFVIAALMLNVLGGMSVGQVWKKRLDVRADEMSRTKLKNEVIWAPVMKEYRIKILEKCLAAHSDLAAATDRCSPGKLFPPL